MSDSSRRFHKALYGFDAAVRRVDPARWSDRSPCEDWTATDVVKHALEMNLMIIGFTRGIDAGAPNGSQADPVAGWQPSLDGVLEALDSAGALQQVAETPWGRMPVDKFLGFAWVDPLIHTWDLAKATGQDPVLDQDLVAQANSRLERAGDSLQRGGGFGRAIETDADASVADRFIALSGRDPAWS